MKWQHVKKVKCRTCLSKDGDLFDNAEINIYPQGSISIRTVKPLASFSRMFLHNVRMRVLKNCSTRLFVTKHL